MRQKQKAKSGSAEKTVRAIRRATRRRHSAYPALGALILAGKRDVQFLGS
jgi:hypothetical protein